jgi:peptide subunit release factor 1 (eRF1)
MAELAGQATRSWAAEREQRLVGEAGQACDGLNAAGLRSCLAAVNAGAAELLIVPEDGLIPGFACQRCGKLSQTGTDCPDWGAASIAVPDLIEEMAVRVRRDGASVETVRELPGGIMARLRFPLSRGEPADQAAHPTSEPAGVISA